MVERWYMSQVTEFYIDRQNFLYVAEFNMDRQNISEICKTHFVLKLTMFGWM